VFFLTLFIGVLISGPAWTGGLLAPFGSDSANVLPRGIRSIQIQSFTTEISETIDANTDTRALGSSLNVTVKLKDLIDGKSSATDRVSTRAYLKRVYGKSYDEDEVMGTTYGEINVRLTTTVPILAYGLTDLWTIAVAIPVIYSNIDVTTGFVPSKRAKALINKVLLNDHRRGSARKAERDSRNPIRKKFVDKGYDPNYSSEKTEIGDVVWINKVQIDKTDSYAVALQPSLVFPTGRRKSIHDPFDIGSGDGQFDLGLKAIADFYVSSRITLTGSVGYVAQLPDKKAFRIPESENESLSSDIDPEVERDLGDISQIKLSARMGLFGVDGLSMMTAYSLATKRRDKYRGDQYELHRYKLLEEGTDQTLEAGQLGFGYSTVPLYRKEGFICGSL